jgi:hypothetical protein
MFWKTGLQPGLSRFWSATPVVGRGRGPHGSAWPTSRMVRSPHNLPKRGIGTPLRESRPQASRIPNDQAGLHEELAAEHVAAARYGRLARSRSSARGNGEGTASHTQGLTLARVDPPGWVNAPAQRSAYCPANSTKTGKTSCTQREGGSRTPDGRKRPYRFSSPVYSLDLRSVAARLLRPSANPTDRLAFTLLFP